MKPVKLPKIKVYGHPRSGNHYLAALINANWYGEGDHSFLLGTHNIPKSLPTGRHIYMMREFTLVAKSIYVIRDRFGLDVDSYEAFLRKPYKAMFNPKMRCRVVADTGKRRMVTVATDYFKGSNKTPQQFHEWHIAQWRKLAKGNGHVLLVQYEDLMSEFESTMGIIGRFVGLPCDSYINIPTKVGWYAPGQDRI